MLDELAKFLYEEETITGEQFIEILNKKIKRAFLILERFFYIV